MAGETWQAVLFLSPDQLFTVRKGCFCPSCSWILFKLLPDEPKKKSQMNQNETNPQNASPPNSETRERRKVEGVYPLFSMRWPRMSRSQEEFTLRAGSVDANVTDAALLEDQRKSNKKPLAPENPFLLLCKRQLEKTNWKFNRPLVKILAPASRSGPAGSKMDWGGVREPFTYQDNPHSSWLLSAAVAPAEAV